MGGSSYDTAASAKTPLGSWPKVKSLKGDTYVDAVHQAMEEIAGGFGAEYTDSGATVGAVARSKKGDTETPGLLIKIDHSPWGSLRQRPSAHVDGCVLPHEPSRPAHHHPV